MGIGRRHNGGGDKHGADSSRCGGSCNVPVGEGVKLEARIVTTGGKCYEHGREPRLVDFEEEFKMVFSIFFHIAWRVKGIIPFTLHPP